MKILAITHRFGPSLIGGAEWHLYRMLRELTRMGVECEVATTTAARFDEIGRWAALWHEGFAPGEETIDGIGVHRFPIRNEEIDRLRRRAAALQRGLHALDWRHPLPCAPDEGGAALGRGWYFAEKHGGAAFRWSSQRSEILLNCPRARSMRFSAFAFRLLHCSFFADGVEFDERVLRKEACSHQIDFPVPAPKCIELRFNHAWRPSEDARELTAAFQKIDLVCEDGNEIPVDIAADWHECGPQSPRDRVKWEIRRGLDCPPQVSREFLNLRGPHSPRLERAAVDLARGADLVLGHCMPQATIALAASVARRAGKPLVTMPLAHLEDSYYHWPFFYEALRQSAFVAANSRFSGEALSGEFGVRAPWVGPGMDPEEAEGLEEEVEAFRRKMNPGGEPVAIFVGRKAPGKRYGLFIESVERVARKRPCVGWIAGPDSDGAPIRSEAVRLLGPMTRREVMTAIGAADVLVLPSESESFGMVFAEAWLMGRPVIGSRRCGAVASLIEDGKDGYLCAKPEEWAARLEDIFADPQRAREMGERGRAKALGELTWSHAARRFLEAVNGIPGKADSKQL